MAVNSFQFKDFIKLLGREIDFDTLQQVSFDYGMEIEQGEEGEFNAEITPERPDMYSVEGYARALRGFLGIETGLPLYAATPSGITINVNENVKTVRPYIGAGVIKNISIDDDVLRSIIRFQEKLHFTWGRKRDKVAIGIYDYDKITGPITYEAVDPDSRSFVPLEMDEELTLTEILRKHPTGKEYAHLLEDVDEYPLLYDAKGNVLSFAPIINSNHSGHVSENTKNIFVEVTGKHLLTMQKTLDMLVTSLADRGGTIETVEINDTKVYNTPVLDYKKIKIDKRDIEKLVGIKINDLEVHLKKMRYGVKKGDSIIVTIPPYRADIISSCDIAEDVAISIGYANITPRKPEIYTLGKGHPREEFSKLVRNVCTSMGLSETNTLVLTNTNDQYSKMEREHDIDYVSVLNAKSSEHNIARPSLMPELLKSIRANKTAKTPMSIFEVDDIILVDENKKPKDHRKLSIVQIDNEAEFSIMRSYVTGIEKGLGVEFTIKQGDEPFYITGRQGSLWYNNEQIGHFGEIHPQVITNFNLHLPIIGMEIDIDKVQKYVHTSITSD